MSKARASKNNDVAQTSIILDKSGLSRRATITLTYRPIVLSIVSRIINRSLSRKTHASDIDVWKGIPAKEMEINCLSAEVLREISARKKENKHA